MTDRFYCPDAKEGATLFRLDDDEAKHLARVRRVKEGEIVEVFDGEGFATRAEVVTLLRNRVELKAIGPALPDRAAAISLTLAIAVPKGDRFDWLIEKTTELGVTRLVPIVTSRSVVDPRVAKLDRLRRNVIEASKQCGRNRLMRIETTTAWTDFLRSKPGAGLVCDPSGSRFPGRIASEPGAEVCVAVGPEGGFTVSELEEARASGWLIVALGSTLLRIETAGIVACARLLAGESAG